MAFGVDPVLCLSFDNVYLVFVSFLLAGVNFYLEKVRLIMIMWMMMILGFRLRLEILELMRLLLVNWVTFSSNYEAESLK